VSSSAVPLKLVADSLTTQVNESLYELNSPNGTGAFYFDNIPANTMVSLEIEPIGSVEEYGLSFRAAKGDHSGYKLNFSPNSKEVRLHNTNIKAVDGLNNKIKVDIVLKGDIIDVCIDNKRCVVNRLTERNGSRLWFYAKHGKVRFSSLKIISLNAK
jgi:hypothetical protein